MLPLFFLQPHPLRGSDLLRTQEVRAPGALKCLVSLPAVAFEIAEGTTVGQRVPGARASEPAALICYAHPSGSFKSSISLCSVPQTLAAPNRPCRSRSFVPDVLVLPMFFLQPHPLRGSDLLRTQEVRALGAFASTETHGL